MKPRNDRKIYLIRHAKPDFPAEERYCLGGATDWPIGAEGRKQCVLLAASFLPALQQEKKDGRSVELWSSPMLRARQTAAYLAEDRQSVRVKEGLEEGNAGVWDGKPFSWIRENYADIFIARGKTSGMALIPGAESNEEILGRSARALFDVLEVSTADDVVIVTHATVIQMLLCALEGLPLSESKRFKPGYTEVVCVPAEKLENLRRLPGTT